MLPMAQIGTMFSPAIPMFHVTSMLIPKNLHAKTHFGKFSASAGFHSSNLMAAEATISPGAERTGLCFKDLTRTFLVDVQKAEGRPLSLQLDVKLRKGSASRVENVGVRVELANGCVGWGEVSLAASSVDEATALVKAREACEFLHWTSPMSLNFLLDEIAVILPGYEFAPVRAGFEMALIDAVANSIDVPLWRLFGGLSNTLSTAITVPSVSPSEASELGSKYYQKGFKILKCTIGKNIDADIRSLLAIQAAHPHCSLILDANGEYSSTEAIKVLDKLHDSGIRLVLFEQPVHGDDWIGLGEVSNVAKGKYATRIAAGASCKSLIDVQRVIRENVADVFNIKLAKVGVVGALEIIEMAREAGLHMMISGTIESRIATGFAGHLAAGLECFEFICLDMPLLLSHDPVVGGYQASGPVYKFLNARGQGGFLKWDMTSW